MDRDTFLDHLRQSRLLSEEQLSRVGERLEGTDSAQHLAGTLVEEGLLTRFQAKQIWAGKSKGLVLGQYRLLEELGKGGFGYVYKARHAMMDRLVAIKVISPELVEDSRARDWFRREVLAATQLCHPNIVMAYDANEVDDVLFLAMEYVDGPNLDTLVKAHGPLPTSLACELMRQAALALQHAHDKGMVHRDVKPANMLIPQGEAILRGLADVADAAPVLVKVVDFGLARLHRSAPAGTLMLQNEKSFLGTPDYVSPEQARNMHAVDIRSDLYSLGCSFYYTLTAQRPFQGTTVLEVVVKHLEKDPEPLEALRPEVPAPVRAIVRRLMAKDPDQRFQTPAELVAALAPLCEPAALYKDLPSPAGPCSLAAGDEPTCRIKVPTRGEMAMTSLVPDLAFWTGPETPREGIRAAPGALRPSDPDLGPGDAGRSASFPTTALVQVLEAPGRDRKASVAPAVAAPPAPRVEVRQDPAAAPQGEARPPAPAGPFRPSPALRTAWRRWVAVVEALAQGEALPVTDPEYRALHAQLLEHARTPAADAGPRPAPLERLEALIEPWLTLRSLAAMDRQTLASLLVRCYHLDRDLGGRGWTSSGRWLGLALVLLVAGGLGWFLDRAYNWKAALKPAYDWARAFTVANPLIALGVAGAVVLVISVYVLSRLLRA